MNESEAGLLLGDLIARATRLYGAPTLAGVPLSARVWSYHDAAHPDPNGNATLRGGVAGLELSQELLDLEPAAVEFAMSHEIAHTVSERVTQRLGLGTVDKAQEEVMADLVGASILREGDHMEWERVLETVEHGQTSGLFDAGWSGWHPPAPVRAGMVRLLRDLTDQQDAGRDAALARLCRAAAAPEFIADHDAAVADPATSDPLSLLDRLEEEFAPADGEVGPVHADDLPDPDPLKDMILGAVPDGPPAEPLDSRPEDVAGQRDGEEATASAKLEDAPVEPLEQDLADLDPLRDMLEKAVSWDSPPPEPFGGRLEDGPRDLLPDVEPFVEPPEPLIDPYETPDVREGTEGREDLEETTDRDDARGPEGV